jgi:hypothetical protein
MAELVAVTKKINYFSDFYFFLVVVFSGTLVFPKDLRLVVLFTGRDVGLNFFLRIGLTFSNSSFR